jgi:hypothetical protein
MPQRAVKEATLKLIRAALEKSLLLWCEADWYTRLSQLGIGPKRTEDANSKHDCLQCKHGSDELDDVNIDQARRDRRVHYD